MWQKQSAAWRADLEITKEFHPWTSRKHFQGTGFSHTKRSLDLLDCAWVQACKRKKITVGTHKNCFMKEAIKQGVHSDLVVDISQNHVRKPLSDSSGFLRTICTSSLLYHFSADRLLHPLEHFFLQGYSDQLVLPQSLSVRDLRSMAGEAICLPCLGSIVWCLHMTRDLTLL